MTSPSAKLVPELICSDLRRSLSFYVDLLGLSVKYERSEERFAYLEREGAELMLNQNPTSRILTAPLEYPSGRGIHLQIKVSSIDALCEAVQRAEWPLYLPLQEKWYRRKDDFVGARHFAVQDTDGYLLRFSEDIGTRPA